MKKRLFSVFGLVAILCSLLGCSLITIQSPFADVNELGTVLKSGEKITIQTTIGPVVVEYAAPTKRRIIWNGKSREFGLLKSTQINGIYSGGSIKFKQSPIGNVYGVSYSESTRTFLSEAEYREHLHVYVEQLGFEHRTNTQMLVNCNVGENPFLKQRKYLYIGIEKYQFADGIYPKQGQ